MKFRYADKSEGAYDRFIGVEIIFFRDKPVYRLDYHGGTIGHR